MPFISISAPSVVSGMSGESEKTLRETFEEAQVRSRPSFALPPYPDESNLTLAVPVSLLFYIYSLSKRTTETRTLFALH
jgi:hypothetical protein